MDKKAVQRPSKRPSKAKVKQSKVQLGPVKHRYSQTGFNMCKQNITDQGAFAASSFSSWFKIDKKDM